MMSTKRRFAPAAAALVAFLALGLGGCKSEAEKRCFGGGSDYGTLTACGEACDHGSKNKKACAKREKMGHKMCFEDKNARACGYMCHAAKSGKDLYCKAEKAHEKKKK